MITPIIMPYMEILLLLLAGFAVVLPDVSAKVNGKSEFEEAKRYLSETITALDRLTWYLEQHYQEGNLDLFIGTRIAEGQLSTLLSRIKEDRNRAVIAISEATERRLGLLRDRLDFVTDRGTSYIRLAEPAYFDRIGGVLVKGLWNIDYATMKHVNKSLIVQVEETEKLKESQSDDCIHTILTSTWKSGSSACIIPAHCWNIMTMPKLYGYSLTHQIFLLEISAKAGCAEKLRQRAAESRTTLSDLADNICANVYGQAREIAQDGFPQPKHDIFIEQTALCGILGYGNFFKTRWLDHMLKWQMPEGCYGEGVTLEEASGGTLAKRSPKWNAGLRLKRQEKRMKDGCSAHRTAVAAAALSAYIKFLILFVSGSI